MQIRINLHNKSCLDKLKCMFQIKYKNYVIHLIIFYIIQINALKVKLYIRLFLLKISNFCCNYKKKNLLIGMYVYDGTFNFPVINLSEKSYYLILNLIIFLLNLIG